MLAFLKKDISKFFFISIFLLLSLQSIFNVIFVSLDLNFPYTTFLFIPSEKFSDFFKVILSYPHQLYVFQPNFSWPHFLRVPQSIIQFIENNPYGGVEALSETHRLTHFLTPPLPNFLNLIFLEAFKWVPAHIIFSLLVGLFYYLVFRLIKLSEKNNRNHIYWFFGFALSYPALFAITRGNFGAMASFLSAFYFLMKFTDKVYYEKNSLHWSLFVLAIGVNFRPNLAILAFIPLVNLNLKEAAKYAASFCLSNVLIFTTFLYLSHKFYDAYSLKNFFIGLDGYHYFFVVLNWGIAYGSSFFSILKTFFGYHLFLEYVNYLIAAILFFYSFYLKQTYKINMLSFVYILSGISLMASPVICDYHLMLFFAVILFGCKNKLLNLNQNISKLIIFSIILLLAPKNYIFSNKYSLQVLLNPIIFLISTIYILKHQEKLSRRRL